MLAQLTDRLLPAPRPWLRLGLLATLFLAGVGLLYYLLPFRPPFAEGSIIAGVDWQLYFHPAIRNLWQGRDPYAYAVYNPPWAFLLLSPFAILPPDLGAAVVFMTGLYVYAYVARRLGASWPLAALIALCPPVIYNSLCGNIDWLVVLGFILPPQAGLFLVLLKPQLGFAIVPFWLVQSWRSGGWRGAVRTFAPATAALALSVLLCAALGSAWPLSTSTLSRANWNVSLWPYGIPVGLALLAAAVRQQDRRCAICASPFLAPYMSPATVALLPLGMLPGRIKAVIGLVFAWLISPVPYMVVTTAQKLLPALRP